MYQTLKEKITPFIHIFFSRKYKSRKNLNSNFSSSIILILKPDKILQENEKTNYLINIDARNPTQNAGQNRLVHIYIYIYMITQNK